MDMTTLMLSVLFGAIGTGLFLFGKREMRVMYIGAGLALMVAPYFLPGPLSTMVVCAGLTGLPFVVDI